MTDVPTTPARPALLVLARHGESARQALERVDVHYPETPAARDLARLCDHEIPLTARGRAQANHLGPFLRAAFGAFDKCYDSGYDRAAQTRELALAAGGYGAAEVAAMRVRSELLLREREAGLHRHMTAAMFAAVPLAEEWARQFACNPFQTRYLGGESVADVADRVRQFRALIIEHHAGRRVLVFCHETVMRAFRIVLLRFDVRQAIDLCRQAIPNTAVHAYQPSGDGWSMSEHLPPFDGTGRDFVAPA